ncbi:MAG TPA: alpha/beta hydrolase [Verrucomicrobiae bacterium]
MHGLGRTSLSMKRVQWTLESAGYKVVNASYPSRRYSVERLSEDYLAKTVAAIPAATPKVHFVTHSLGGILVREYLSHHAITNLGRVVMLAPPNHGSRLADTLKRTAAGRWIMGPAGCELGTTAHDAPQRFGLVNFQLGIIAGDRSLNPLFSRALQTPNDGKVSVESAKAAGMADFTVVHSSHTWMACRAETLRQVLAFLRGGHFGTVRLGGA